MTKEIRLRALTTEDLPQTLAWNNQPDIVEQYAGHPFPVNLEREQKWYDRMLTSNYPATAFGIEIVETKTLIGVTVLRDINLVNRSAESATYIADEEARLKGYFIDSMLLSMDFGFSQLGLNRIMGKVILETNARLVKAYKSFGLVQEGVLRDAVFKNGKYYSLAVFSTLRSEYYSKFRPYLDLNLTS